MRYLGAITLFLSLASCPPKTSAIENAWIPVTAPDLGEVVATVGRVPIFAAQVLAEIKKTGRPPREALGDLIEFHLLAEAARLAGRYPAGASDAMVQVSLVQRLLERDLEPGLLPSSVPDAVLHPLYEKARDRFVHPRLVEVGVLAIYTGALMKVEPRHERAQSAKDLGAFLAQHPVKTLEDFAGLAKLSEWSERHVVYTRLLQSPDRPLSRAVGIEVAKLHAPGDSTRMVEDEDGFFVARYIGERPPENVPFEAAREALRTATFDRWRKQRFLELSSGLAQLHKVETHFEALGRSEIGP